jgi:O-antigen ligase
MMTAWQKSSIGLVLSLTALSATVVMAPSTLYDPINLPKLAVIVIGSFVAFGLLSTNLKTLWKTSYRPYTLWVIIFNLHLVIVLLVSEANNIKEFYGADGRSTGLLAYCSLSLILFVAILSATETNLERVSKFLFITFALSLVYGILQNFGADPIKWNLMYSPVMGFLGNPNFQSSFLGMAGVLIFARILDKNQTLVFKSAYAFCLLLTLFVIRASNSQQGFLVLAGGLTFVFLVWISKSKFKKLTIPGLSIAIFGFFVVLFGTLNKGPLAALLFKDSVTFRGDYWTAGWNMTTSNPLFGIGVDNYGDWYRRTRTLEATLRRGPDVTSNAAHNVFLDFSSNGGIPLVLIYFFVIAMVIRAAAKLIWRQEGFNAVSTGLIGAWIAYQAQSVISLNQLGLAIWGWLLSGLIIGYEIETRKHQSDATNTQPSKPGRSASIGNRNKNSDSKILVGGLAGGLISLLAIVPALNASIQVRNANKETDPIAVQNVAKLWPHSSAVQFEVAYILAQAKFPDLAVEILKTGLSESPDNFVMWRLLTEIPTVSEEEKAEARSQMKRLDPLNPNLK